MNKYLIFVFVVFGALFFLVNNSYSTYSLNLIGSNTSIGHACSYYNLNVYGNTNYSEFINKLQTFDVSYALSKVGVLRNVSVSIMLNMSYNVKTPVYTNNWELKNITNSTIPDNCVKINDTTMNCTYKEISNYINVTKYGYRWVNLLSEEFGVPRYTYYNRPDNIIRNDVISNKYNDILRTLVNEGNLKIKVCGDYTPSKTYNGWGESIDYIPHFDGVDYTNFAWWNSTWKYREPINITNPNSENLNEYQIKMNVSYKSGMNTSFKDIRFTYYNATSDTESEIPYWIEQKSDGSWAVVWIKVPYIHANANSTVYMYFDNPNATSESNPNNVFDLYDDFNGNSLNSSKWTIDCTGSYTISNSVITINENRGDHDHCNLYSKKSWSSGKFIINTKVAGHTDYVRYRIGWKNDYYNYDDGGSNWWGLYIDKSQVDSWGYDVSSGGLVGHVILIFNGEVTLEDPSHTHSFSESTDANLSNLMIASWCTSDISIDQVLVRKYASQEPTVTFGEVQKVNSPPQINSIKFYHSFKKVGNSSYCNSNNVIYSNNNISIGINVPNINKDYYLIVEHIKNSNTLYYYVNGNLIGESQNGNGNSCNGNDWAIDKFLVSDNYLVNGTQNIKIVPSGSDSNYVNYVALVNTENSTVFGKDWDIVAMLNVTDVNKNLESVNNSYNQLINNSNIFFDFFTTGTSNITRIYYANDTYGAVTEKNVTVEVDSTPPTFSEINGSNAIINFNESYRLVSYSVNVFDPHLGNVSCYVNNVRYNCTSNGNKYTISYNVTNYGTYKIGFKAEDTLGNINSTYKLFNASLVRMSINQIKNNQENLYDIPAKNQNENVGYNYNAIFEFNINVFVNALFNFNDTLYSKIKISPVSYINITNGNYESWFNNSTFKWKDSFNSNVNKVYKLVVKSGNVTVYWKDYNKTRYFRIISDSMNYTHLYVRLRLYTPTNYSEYKYHSELYECTKPSNTSRYSCDGKWISIKEGLEHNIKYIEYDTTLSDKLFKLSIESGPQIENLTSKKSKNIQSQPDFGTYKMITYTFIVLSGVGLLSYLWYIRSVK